MTDAIYLVSLPIPATRAGAPGGAPVAPTLPFARWPVGRLLSAVVLGTGGGPGRGDGQPVPPARLLIEGVELRADSRAALRSGERLTLRVESNPNRPTLTIIARAPPAAPAALTDGLRMNLPVQRPLPETLATLLRHAIPAGAGTSAPPLSTPVRRALDALVSALPRRESVQDGARLRQAIEDSGARLEARLLRSAGGLAEPARHPRPDAPTRTTVASPGGGTEGGRMLVPAVSPAAVRGLAADFKGNLARLRTTLRAEPAPEPPSSPAPRSLGEAVDAALARLRVVQLTTASQSDDTRVAGPRSGAFELPVVGPEGPEPIAVWVEPEPPEPSAGDKLATGWTVHLALDLPGLGPLEVRVGYRAGGVSVTVWAEAPDAIRAFNEGRDELERRLGEQALELSAMRCFPGPRRTAPEAPARSGPLVREII